MMFRMKKIETCFQTCILKEHRNIIISQKNVTGIQEILLLRARVEAAKKNIISPSSLPFPSSTHTIVNHLEHRCWEEKLQLCHSLHAEAGTNNERLERNFVNSSRMYLRLPFNNDSLHGLWHGETPTADWDLLHDLEPLELQLGELVEKVPVCPSKAISS